MLLPRFKLRTALVCLTVAAFVSLLFREGAQGTSWAIGASIGLASLFLWLLLMAMFYLATLVFGATSIRGHKKREKGSFYASSVEPLVTPTAEGQEGGRNE